MSKFSLPKHRRHPKPVQCLETSLEKLRKATISLVGPDEAGHWKTAQAKEYPFRLSCALANAMLTGALKHGIPHADVTFMSQLQEMFVFCSLISVFC